MKACFEILLSTRIHTSVSVVFTRVLFNFAALKSAWIVASEPFSYWRWTINDSTSYTRRRAYIRQITKHTRSKSERYHARGSGRRCDMKTLAAATSLIHTSFVSTPCCIYTIIRNALGLFCATHCVDLDSRRFLNEYSPVKSRDCYRY